MVAVVVGIEATLQLVLRVCPGRVRSLLLRIFPVGRGVGCLDLEELLGGLKAGLLLMLGEHFDVNLGRLCCCG